MKLDAEGAARGIAEKIAKPLKMDTVAAAQAIVEIAISKMSLAVREVSVAKGYDPRDFALVASGGAGPLHVIAIARELHIPTVIVPLFPSHFSALGMLLADERHDFIRTYYSDLASVDFAALVKVYDEMREQARASLRHTRGAAGADPARPALCRPGVHAVGAGHARAAQGRQPQGDPQGLRCALRAPLRAPFAGRAGRDGQHAARRRSASARSCASRGSARRRAATPRATARSISPTRKKPVRCPVYQRDALKAGARIVGPAIVQELGTTTVLFKSDDCTVAPSGELIIKVGGA